MRRWCHRAVSCAVAVALAGCTGTPTMRAPPVHAPALTVTPPPPVVTVAPPALVQPPAPIADDDLWARLRSSFAMDDCQADPAILSWARDYTRDSDRFESQWHDALPRLAYVAKVAGEHGVPGEFALLPWVESHYRPVRSRRGRPVGIWQIMPQTAAAMGLKRNTRYDGRLNDDTATSAVMQALNRYHDEFGDWRVADYAYNAGESSVRAMIAAKGTPPADPAIPRLPVNRTTREHLTKLLGIACVVREPQRFGVTLPRLQPERRLVSVPVPASTSVADLAARAGMTEDALRHTNAALTGERIDTRDSSHVLLPLTNARQLVGGPPAWADGTGLRTAAIAPPQVDLPPLVESEPRHDRTTRVRNGKTAAAKAPRSHVVSHGETLWDIAHHYHVDVASLERWNRLHGAPLQPGQKLKIAAPR